MEEYEFWKRFEQTGKIEDYIKYAQMKQREGLEGTNAISNGWTDHQRERRRGK